METSLKEENLILSVTEEEACGWHELELLQGMVRCYQSGRLPRASSGLHVLHFMKGPWSHTQLEWNPDLKESKSLPA